MGKLYRLLGLVTALVRQILNIKNIFFFQNVL